MGYWGHLLLAWTKDPLAALTEARAFGEPEDERRLIEDWSLLRAGHEPPDLRTALASVVQATRMPALVAYVLDSDCAVLEAQTPAGLRWTAVLNRATAEASYEGVADGVLPVDQVMAGAIGWANEAGLKPDQQMLSRALTEQAVFVEDLFDELLVGLGIPGVEKPGA
ncbi:MAG TPA: hypothetical protein VIT43_02475 [Candidatus Dormibacteraeota bacterium]